MEHFFNQAATAHPRPKQVREAMVEALEQCAQHNKGLLQQATQALEKYFQVAAEQKIFFTASATQALALVLNRLKVTPGQKILCSTWEHHAVSSVLQVLQDKKLIEMGVVPAQAGWGEVEGAAGFDLKALERELSRGGVRAVVMTSASHVTGEMFPLLEVRELTKKYQCLLLIDASQSVGYVDYNLSSLRPDAFIFAGHKHLKAPQGVAAIILGPDLELHSHQASCDLEKGICQNGNWPSYCDLGALVMPALAGLGAALALKQAQGGSAFNSRLDGPLREGLLSLGLKIHRPRGTFPCTPVLSVSHPHLDMKSWEKKLAEKGMEIRVGQHCSPLSFEFLKVPHTLRISWSDWHSEQDIHRPLELLRCLCIEAP